MAAKEPRLTAPTLKVLGALMSPIQASGAEIGRTTNIPSGTLYPILLRLEDAGWVESEWETADPTELERPRRRLYRITGVGAKKTTAAIREIALPIKELAWQ
jgi:PadR family transcriptional regulator